ncbi:hypothetical protein ACFFUB_14535 [Algimonas porphyrae]|uniref:Uncharacterized protein n=1 Tax=Algimonas porphyrae TaxID=1128113 RepID=A0ABQ5V075_9PROT|nr:hypothetical protein [Algimonas porphyrae]GLQ19642.1 hypothetical protein GCM10007854_05970 [Algimonas porphyrae]
MYRTQFRLAVTASVCALLSTACVSMPGVGVGVTAGTTGVAAEVKANPLPTGRLLLRGAYNFAEFSGEIESDGIEYEGDFTLSNAGAFADFAPFGGPFYLSGGAYIGKKEADLVATPANNVVIGGTTFTPAQVGSLLGTAEFNDVAPYAGIAFDNFARSIGGWSFNARAGVMFVGSADVNLVSANGLLSSDPALLTELREEIESIEEDAEDYKYFPVVTLGITRRF